MVEKIQLESDEHILLQVRKHWFVLALQVLGIIVAALIPLLFVFVATNLQTFNIVNIPFDYPTVIAFYTLWLLLLWMMLFNIWTNYYLDVWTVTNKRLIAVDQKGFFFRTTASFRFERLQDIIVSVDGIIATLLDFGSLEIQTAGIEKNFKAYNLPSPAHIKSTILNSTDILIARNKPNQATQNETAGT